MGNYVLQYALDDPSLISRTALFDNVILVAADVNNRDHEVSIGSCASSPSLNILHPQLWCNRIKVRNRLYIVINEHDKPLEISKLLPGDEQETRLGHSLVNLSCPHAIYVDVTNHVATDVEGSHAYFARAQANPAVSGMFGAMYNGKAVERQLTFNHRWFYELQGVHAAAFDNN